LLLTDLRSESISNSTVWKLRLICFAFLVVDLAVLAVILLFHDVKGWKLRRIVKNLQQAKKPISYISVYIGGEYEKQSIENLAKIINEGEDYGIPVLAVTAVGKEMVRDSKYLSLASRICVEIGAHMVKTYYCGDFGEVVEACGNVPVVIAGGKKIEEKAALQMASSAIKDGAAGVDMGRNIFQSDNPVGMIKAVRAIVHENKAVDEAFKIYKKK
jgi:hypothetical protein